VAVKLGVSAALLALLFSRVDMSAFAARIRNASPAWLFAALVVYVANILASTWRWRRLLDAQHVRVPSRSLLASYLVAGFFNNFLPSNIGGDVVRITDTARAAGSRTLATMVVFVDRGLGLLGLVLVAAIGATMAAGGRGDGATPIWPSWLWAGFLLGTAAALPVVLAPESFTRLLRPLSAINPVWVNERIDTLTNALARFRDQPAAIASCFGGAVVVQGLLVLFYFAVVHALRLPIGLWDLSVIVPVSFLVQMLPVSMNGFGVREAAFSFYFTNLGVPIESAVLLPLVATALIIAFSLSGAVLYVGRAAGARAPAAGEITGVQGPD
jgi:hypothetical protein